MWEGTKAATQAGVPPAALSNAHVAAPTPVIRAHMRRVMERYPNNGKLLKVYGRFLEYVRNDPWSASKYYAGTRACRVARNLWLLSDSVRRD